MKETKANNEGLPQSVISERVSSLFRYIQEVNKLKN